MSESEAEGLRPTPLTSRHRSRDAVMGDFAGYDMPIHYPMGILAEQMGRNGQRAVYEKYNWGIEESKLLQFYKQLT